jgi:hypothetical protein
MIHSWKLYAYLSKDLEIVKVPTQKPYKVVNNHGYNGKKDIDQPGSRERNEIRIVIA